MNDRPIIFKLLLVSMILEAMIGGWLFYAFILPVLPRLGLLTQAGITGLLLGVPYYFTAFIAFALQKSEQNPALGSITIAGRRFKADMNFLNPTNHIICSATIIFAGLILLGVSRL